MSLWVGALLLAVLLIKVARDDRAYRRALREERLSFEAYCDERAARSRLGYPVETPRAIRPAKPVLNGSTAPTTGTRRGGAHERQFDELQDTPG